MVHWYTVTVLQALYDGIAIATDFAVRLSVRLHVLRSCSLLNPLERLSCRMSCGLL